jgi:ribosome modulation factor
MNKYEQEGYNAYIRALLAHGEPRGPDALHSCPYFMGTNARRDFMNGWKKARDEA